MDVPAKITRNPTIAVITPVLCEGPITSSFLVNLRGQKIVGGTEKMKIIRE
jgi:hypothetical protein